MINRRSLTWTGLAALAAGRVAHAQPARLRVFAAGAVQGPIEALHDEIARALGAPIDATIDTVGALRDRVLAGERVDAVLLSAPAIDALAQAGRIAAGSRHDLGRVGVALVVRAGTPAPAIGTADELRAALLAAPSIAYADPARGATAGQHFRRVLERLGIADTVAARSILLPFGGEVAPAVAQGRVAIGASQASELVGRPGVALVGYLPDPHQLWTVYSVAAVSGAAPATERLIAVLRSEASRLAFRRGGFEPV